MFKKIKKFLEENIVGRYEELEKRYLSFEERVYSTLEQRLDRLESRIDALSSAMRGEPVQEEKEATAMENQEAKDLSLDQLKGLGPSMISKLNQLDIFNLEHLANLTSENIEAIDLQIKGFKVRCERYQWVEEAKRLLGL
jgi:predicted flap endonuclease-1-like 5' DNA nuclease